MSELKPTRLPIDTVTSRRLAVVRQVYQAGAHYRTRSNPSGRMLSVLSYDLAIETALKAVVRAINPSVGPKSELSELAAQAASALASAQVSPLPPAPRLVRVVRNAVQHEGRLPTATEEDECHGLARAYLDAVLSTVWGASLSTVTVSDFIDDDRSKSALSEAQKLYEGGDFAGAIVKAADALDLALARVKTALVGRGDTWAKAIMVEDTFRRSRSSADLTRSIERTQTTVLYLALGLDYGEYLRLQAITGSGILMDGGQVYRNGAKPDPDEDDADFAIAYTSEAIVSIEARVGSIAKPYGRERWY